MVRAQVRRRHERGAGARRRRLPQLQRLLHPRAEGRRAAARRCRPGLPGRRHDQPVRPHRARPDPAGQGPPLFDDRAGRRRSRARRALPRRQLRDALPEPEGLPPHPHAVRRHADADDPCPGRAVLGQPDDGARRAGPVRPQRARRLRVRVDRPSARSCSPSSARPSSAAWRPSGTARCACRACAGCANGTTPPAPCR